ncbi:MAG: ABC transporter permease [Thermomicrobiales bacterium]
MSAPEESSAASAKSSTGPSPARPVARPTNMPEVRRHRGAQIGPSVSSAATALWANRLRSLLTALGVVVGVAAVIAVVTLTQGTAALINQRVAGLGTTTLVVQPGALTSNGARQGAGTGTSLTEQDAQAIGAVPHVVNVSPVIVSNAQVVSGGLNWNTRVQGVYPSMQAIQTWSLSEGAWYTDADESGGTAVAVIGQTVVDNLFTPSGTDPVGQLILIRGQPFRVVGVLAAKGSTGFNNQDDTIFMPFSTAGTRLVRANFVSQIQAEVDTPANVDSTQQAITTLLEQRHNLPSGGPDDFNVRSPTQFVQTAQQFQDTLTVLLVGVAAISLLVGGIGIMNIMLVSVTERTREIGIRKAVGAQQGDILRQFLIEAILISVGGGLLGILLGFIIANLVTLTGTLTSIVTPGAALLAVGFSLAVGLFFGIYPARRAARLDPIVALRYE